MTPFDWRDFLRVAVWIEGRLVADPDPTIEDAVLRTVIGRAYYAAFHVARAFVNAKVQDGTLRWPATRRSIHDKVWDALKAHPDRSVSDLGDKGVDLKDRRTEADYSLAPNKERARIAREAIRLAREIVTGLDAAT